MPIAADVADYHTGAVYSLEDTFVKGTTDPPIPLNSQWIAIAAHFPDPDSKTSLLRFLLQQLIYNLYTTRQEDFPGTLTVTTDAKYLSSVLGTYDNDVIVPYESQTKVVNSSGTVLAVPSQTLLVDGDAEHTPGVPKVSIPSIPGVLSDRSVLRDPHTDDLIMKALISQ